jgi:hypothetical protein
MWTYWFCILHIDKITISYRSLINTRCFFTCLDLPWYWILPFVFLDSSRQITDASNALSNSDSVGVQVPIFTRFTKFTFSLNADPNLQNQCRAIDVPVGKKPQYCLKNIFRKKNNQQNRIALMSTTFCQFIACHGIQHAYFSCSQMSRSAMFGQLFTCFFA